ncbi:MAG: aminoacyl-tRNA hydrolase [Candidatus Omnitrophica bacterium]|nr:aminoacyl-tRNA hydrolase [Candidatus Omnitrophota bacterium]
MRVIVGLGNPGHTYHGTRHNVGFGVIQLLAERRRVELKERIISSLDQRPAGVWGAYRLGEETVRLLMPLTMMNESGEALREAPCPLARLLVVCDDVNLPLGSIRMRPVGSDGGHHGLASCLSVLGTEQVPRLRIGVGIRELPPDLEQFVLSPFRGPERPLIKRAIEQAADACEAWVTDGIEHTMNRYNQAQEP